MRAREKVLSLQALLSKALDSLCLQLAITSCDENSLGLLEYCMCQYRILQWRLNEQISRQQFSELYKGWLEAKHIINIFNTQQLESYDKVELYGSDRLPRDILSIVKVWKRSSQITKALELINDEYNEAFMSRHGQQVLLEGVEKLFSYLDPDGVIHLRASPLLFLMMALILAGRITLKEKTIDGFLRQFAQFKLELNHIQGKVSLRNFKNFMIKKCPEEIVEELPRIFKDLERKMESREAFPNIFRQAFSRWKSNPRFLQNKRKLEVYERIFEEHEDRFFSSSPEDIAAFFQGYYGDTCLRLYGIDQQVVAEFHQNLHSVQAQYTNNFLNCYSIELSRPAAVSRVTKKRDSKISTPVQDILLRKSLSTSKFEPESVSHKLATSVERLSRTMTAETPPKHKPRLSSNTPHSLARSTAKATTPAGLIYRQVQQLQKLDFFRNKRVQPFEVVIRRLKQR